MKKKFSIEIVEGPEVGKAFVFRQAIVNIGRKATGNDLILNNQTVSGEHARISYVKGRFFLQDLGGINGTLLNGVPVDNFKQVGLKHGDQIRLGSIDLRFWEDTRAGKKAASDKNADVTRISGFSLGRRVRRSPGPTRHSRKRILFLAAGLIGLLIILMAVKVFMGPSTMPETTEVNAPDLSDQPLPLPAPHVYGYTGASDNNHPNHAIFTFTAETSRAEITYTPGAIDTDGEVVISFNGTSLGNVPLAKGAWGSEQVLRLDKGVLTDGQENRLVFDNTLNPPEKQMWGVKNLRIVFLPAVVCDLAEGRRLFDLAENMYNEKAISDGNLYHAVGYYSQASDMIGACEPKPEFWPTLETKLVKTEVELDTRYKNLKFSYLKKIKLNQYQAAQKDLEAMLRLIPDKNDPRYEGPARLLERLNEILGE